jgi:hypothetical protein
MAKLLNGLGAGEVPIAAISNGVITANRAIGGAGGIGGVAGKGIGGGVYNTGTTVFQNVTITPSNKASTSNDEVFP